jgi:protein ImuA
MNPPVANRLIIEQLQKQILSLQGNRQATDDLPLGIGLGFIEAAFPDKVFPRGAVHELISTSSETASCTNGFISVVLNKLMQQGGSCLWVSTVPRRSIFPPALKSFGIDPERILFVDTAKPKDTLWVLEEALKCNALNAVVGELSEISFNDSRRLQLAVESSKVTGFIHRYRPKSENIVACVSRWKITPLASSLPDALPGVGFPRWNVELSKVRNGQPGNWQVQWSPLNGLEEIGGHASALDSLLDSARSDIGQTKRKIG